MSIPQSQKALALPGPLEPYTLITHPVPTPGEGDVLVKVESTGLNPAENHVTNEAARWVIQGYPALTGTDGAGTIVALGKGVVGFEVGDRVFFQGELSRHSWLHLTINILSFRLVCIRSKHLSAVRPRLCRPYG